MRKIKIIAIVLIASFSLNAQNQIEGRVLELSQDGKSMPILGANVYWEETKIGTTTDVNGSYLINKAEICQNRSLSQGIHRKHLEAHCILPQEYLSIVL